VASDFSLCPPIEPTRSAAKILLKKEVALGESACKYKVKAKNEDCSVPEIELPPALGRFESTMNPYSFSKLSCSGNRCRVSREHEYKTLGKSNLHRGKAFTLIELLLVIAIIGLISALIVPAVGPLMKGANLTNSTMMVRDQLNLARQQALVRNRTVEVRFYKYADPNTPGESAAEASTWKFRAFQAFEVVSKENFTPADLKRYNLTASSNIPYLYKPLDRMQRLQQGIIFNSSRTLSSIFDTSKRKAKDGSTDLNPKQPLPDAGDQYQYFSIKFNPDGTTDLYPVTDNWFLTIHDKSAGDGTTGSSATAPPANFATIQVDPVNGNIRVFRP
jgi:uncharacterized protein (TIGR02596 family)